MSATIIAYTIVGSLVDIDDFFDSVERDIHKDCETLGPGPRCATCGEPLGETEFEGVPVKGFDPEAGMDEQGSIGGINLVKVRWGDDARYFVPAAVCEVSEYRDRGKPKRMDPVDMDAAREKIRAVLEPAGLWDPDEFGIWTALYYS